MFDQILQRLIRVVKFDNTVWEEIEHDLNANTEAAVVVVASSLLAAIGAGIAGGIGSFFLTLIIGPLINWLAWSGITMLVGTKLFEGESDFWEMARVIGYANAPRALAILTFIPCVGAIIGLATFALSLYFGFLAVREGLDLPNEKAILTVVIGWVVAFVINLVLMASIGGMAALVS
jgi:hypothetical protein